MSRKISIAAIPRSPDGRLLLVEVVLSGSLSTRAVRLLPLMDARLGTALEGRYTVDREIGAGGMATVYLARDDRHNRNVALKVLNPELGAVLGVER
ncbi:MAG: hypothetical protein ABIV11_05385, partial [Gemmatimonadaceae bacterium]